MDDECGGKSGLIGVNHDLFVYIYMEKIKGKKEGNHWSAEKC